MLLGIALGALLLTIQPVGAQSTGDCETIGGELTCSYVEGSTGRVFDFVPDPTPPARAAIAWTLVTTQADRTTAITTHPDHGDFSIDQESGVLTFKSPPNYENPSDGDHNNDGDNTDAADTNNAVEEASDNIYKVKVRLEVDTDAGRTTSEQGVSVTVTNKEEDGSVSLNNLQPQVRELITATLGDPDGSKVESTWQWSSSSSRSSGYTDIAGATADSYRPVEGDTGMYLRATVTYTDGHGAEIDTAMTESVEAVRAETGADNADPAFGEGETATRAIDENTPAGTNIGPPVAATDDDLDVLSYSLGDGVASSDPNDADGADTLDDGLFSIDAATGQLMTKAALNVDAPTTLTDRDTTDADVLQLQVTVIVKDPLGNRVDDPALDTITVTITVNDVNEAPTVSGPVLLIRHEEGSLRALSAGAVPALDLRLDSLPDDSDDETTLLVNPTTFTAADPDGETATQAVTWELSGPDASKFRLSDGDTDAADARTDREDSHPLRFKATANFEKPGDANKDNVYEITVTARDGQLVTGSRDVTIRVTNRDENGGVSLSHIQPEVATNLTAKLVDQDGGITGLKWQWMRDTTGTAATATADCTDSGLVFDKITGKTSPTYKPAPGDEGKCLRVTATYDDTVRNKDIEEPPGPEGIDESEPTVESDTSEHPVRAAVSPNDRPYFEADGAPTDPPTRVTSYTRYITENQPVTPTSIVRANTDGITEPVDPITDDVGATDVVNDDGDDATTDDPTDVGFLQYELGGASKDYFRIDQTTQTAVAIRPTKMLNREDKSRHTVTVKVTDPSGGTATATVTIIVVDVDEAPKIDDAGPMHVMHMENDKAAVANYMATDPEGKAITWTVLGSDPGTAEFDMEDLKVTAKAGPRTMLAFKSAPNYESPEGGALAETTTGKGNIYTVKLRAAVNDAEETDSTAGETIDPTTEMDTVDIMVGVTDVPEAPEFSDASKTLTVDEHVTGDPLHGNVGSRVTATDSDGEIHLTYSLSGTDAGYFTIVPATGQIKTMKRLDYETKDSFSVVVTATDPTGLSDTINITIKVDDVAEAPDIVPDGVAVSGDTDVDYNEKGTAAVGTYTVEGPQATSARWTLEGADRGDFSMDPTSGASSMLKFKSSPDYEAPADADTNNTYMVTINAAVGGDIDTQEVTVTVANVEEDGTVALPSASPVVGGEVTAILTDPDGSISGLSWDWHTSSDMATWSAAPGTETNDPMSFTSTYTTVADDVDKYLRATASYTDGYDSGNSEQAVSAKVLAADVNVAPRFPTATTTRSIAENMANADIGDPIVANDANGDTLAYTLEGTDMASFRIVGSTGQLQTSAALNFEAKNAYAVVVKATDPGQLSDTITVTINVTDVVDEEVPVDVVQRYDTGRYPGNPDRRVVCCDRCLLRRPRAAQLR